MSRFENILEDCLIRLRRGDLTVEECLAQYPEHAEELRRLFVAATHLERGRAVRPSSTFKARGRAELMAHMKARPRNRLGRWWAAVSPFQFYPAFSRAVNVAIGLAAILFLSLTTGTVLAQDALPGETLYGWKIASEEFVQAVYPDSLAIDLIVSERRNQDLARVVSNPTAWKVALEEYQEALEDLSAHTAPQAKEKISDALAKQQANLAQAQVVVPELERLLAAVEETSLPVTGIPQEAELQLDYEAATVRPGTITYNITVANSGPFEPATAKLTSRLSPAETLVSADESRCTVSSDGVVTCTLDGLQAGQPQNLTLTTKVDPCYSGVVEHEATLEGAEGETNLNPRQVVARTDFTASFPRPAKIAYVQSSEPNHDLGLVASTADPLNSELHLHAAAPAWSPDGTQLAFFGEQGISELGGIYAAGNGLWVIDVVGVQSQDPRLLSRLDHIKNVAWSPDGLKIAVEVGPPNIPHEIYIVDARDGHEISRFPGEQPAWSPNSQRLVIKSCEPGCGLWLVNTQGSIQKQVTTNGTDSYPVWSPDGQYLVFSSLERANNWEIYRLDWADNQLTRLTHRPGTDTTPVFGPCSQEIYLRTDQYGSWWITAMKLDGTGEYKVQEGVGSTTDWGLARPAVR